MSYIPPLKGRPRKACETLHALGGPASAGEVGRAAGFPPDCVSNVMNRLVTAGCARVADSGRPRLYELTPDWLACLEGHQHGIHAGGAGRPTKKKEPSPAHEADLEDPAQDVPPAGFRTSIPRAPWDELQRAWR